MWLAQINLIGNQEHDVPALPRLKYAKHSTFPGFQFSLKKAEVKAHKLVRSASRTGMIGKLVAGSIGSVV